ncbi:Acetyl-CoA acetyltransferase [Parafrankia irregularis]|uniref:Acetyl-CoA acetyltransferase n=1 Tax=Parafrankia irregularis TaxID=795642 RepID=A0A0S4QWL6_9ACTN|nr:MULTISPECIES: thiolase family protein [Parafrankia]MBE3199978.1 thiolase family protein [Parafrankia sp. CH37]CUU59276.1 Acetyl-CoA acetyltransferase [Parafrankia irregularis]
MSGRLRAGNQVAVVGYAHSALARHAARPLGTLAVDTARAAIADAGLTVAQIDGFVTGARFPTVGDHPATDGVTMVSSAWLAARLGARPRHVAGFQGTGQLPGSVALAVNAIAAGAADHVLVHRALHNPAGAYHASDAHEASGARQWTMPQGFFGPVATIALAYNEYLQKYGASRESMAAVVVEARKNGARIPWSYWHGKPLTAGDYLAAPMINDPIRRLDCDLPVDGVAAFVLTSARRAADLPHRPVYIAGCAGAGPTRPGLALHWPLDDIRTVGAETGRRLWESAGIGPADVDLPQLYDGFSPFVYFWLEALGFCPEGEAHRFVQAGGIDSDSPKGLPVLSGGGALGNGRMHGIPQMLECYLQLSGRAAGRQREQARVGLAAHASPHLGGAVVYSAEQF